MAWARFKPLYIFLNLLTSVPDPALKLIPWFKPQHRKKQPWVLAPTCLFVLPKEFIDPKPWNTRTSVQVTTWPSTSKESKQIQSLTIKIYLIDRKYRTPSFFIWGELGAESLFRILSNLLQGVLRFSAHLYKCSGFVHMARPIKKYDKHSLWGTNVPKTPQRFRKHVQFSSMTHTQV